MLGAFLWCCHISRLNDLCTKLFSLQRLWRSQQYKVAFPTVKPHLATRKPNPMIFNELPQTFGHRNSHLFVTSRFVFPFRALSPRSKPNQSSLIHSTCSCQLLRCWQLSAQALLRKTASSRDFSESCSANAHIRSIFTYQVGPVITHNGWVMCMFLFQTQTKNQTYLASQMPAAPANQGEVLGPHWARDPAAPANTAAWFFRAPSPPGLAAFFTVFTMRPEKNNFKKKKKNMPKTI